MPDLIKQPLQLPCGVHVHNRLCKAAMTERLAGPDGSPNALHNRLYQAWLKTGAGLLITGNMMINRNHLESGGNIIVDQEAILPKLQELAKQSQSATTQTWVQISHSGRQTSRLVNLHPKAPSSVQLKKWALFGTPRAMTEADIQEVIAGFVRTAKLCQQAGFRGIQIHSAHGYLLSQFLSPHTNLRQDQWGGSLENRSRLLRTILTQVRKVVGPAYPVSVKLNSADFQRGGLTEEESLVVVQMLQELGVDLLEISGGTYEKMAFFTKNEEVANQKESTRRREAYFLDFAHRVREICQIPLMITGGFRTYDFCQSALADGAVDIIGMARPFLLNLPEMADF
ncbi:MAG: NADH:flavin oxidoreductase/NADH oxidase family protein, partial [Bacteroidota bacterium]